MPLIDYDLLHTVFPQASQHISSSVSNFNSIIGVTGDSRDIEGCIYLNMIIGNIHCSQIFHVVKKLQPECLLGRDFLRQYECVLDFTTHTLRSTKLAQLRVDSTIMIPPRATSVCHADISDNRHFITGTIMEVFAKPLPNQLKVSHNKLAVHIFNNSDREITLPRNTLVAVARPISHTAEI